MKQEVSQEEIEELIKCMRKITLPEMPDNSDSS